jgi:hypothetical protein
MQDTQPPPPNDPSVHEPAPAMSSSSPPPGPVATSARPMGVTVIAILAAISGVFQIFGGLLLLLGSSALGVAFDSAALGGLAAVIGAVTLLMGVLLLVFAWGAWGLEPWAWTLGVVLQAIAIVLGLYNLLNGSGGGVISIAIAALITWYLFQPDVRRAFGRE